GLCMRWTGGNIQSSRTPASAALIPPTTPHQPKASTGEGSLDALVRNLLWKSQQAQHKSESAIARGRAAQTSTDEQADMSRNSAFGGIRYISPAEKGTRDCESSSCRERN